MENTVETPNTVITITNEQGKITHVVQYDRVLDEDEIQSIVNECNGVKEKSITQ